MKPKPASKSSKLSVKTKRDIKASKSSVRDLVTESRSALAQGDLSLARSHASLACTLLPPESSNTEPVELLGEICAELDDVENARECFVEAVRRKSDSEEEEGGWAKYLWLGQLSPGLEGVSWYKKGIENLKEWMRRVGDRDEWKTRISEAECGIVEIWMTDLCMESNAESECEIHIHEALLQTPSSPTVHALLASVRLSQSRHDDAVASLQTSLSFWLPQIKESTSSLTEVPIPSYEARMSLVKLLLEVELYPEALDVLSTLQVEDEENVDLWYLYACGYFHQHDTAKKEENWRDAKECLIQCLSYYEKLAWDDEALRKSAIQMLEDIKTAGIKDDEAESEDENWQDEEEWAGIESDDKEDVEMDED